MRAIRFLRTPRAAGSGLAVLAVWLLLAAGGVSATSPDGFAGVGLVDPDTGVWYLRDRAGGGTDFYYGNPGDYPFVGDWDCDGVDTPGLYRQSDGYAYLRNSNTQGNADIKFYFGNPGDVPIAGDFDGDGCDTLSIYRSSQQRFYIINELGSADTGLGAAEYWFAFGNPADVPFAGDFDGDGWDEVGLYRGSSGFLYYEDQLTPNTGGGAADHQFYFGNPGDRFVAADWTDDGVDGPGVYRPATTTYYLRYFPSQGNADEAIPWGEADWYPVAGYFGVLPMIPISFGAGTWQIGADIPAGTYRNSGFTTGCYWARLSGFGGTLEEIIENSFNSVRQIVEITPTDVGFHSNWQCGTWSNDLSASKNPTASFGGGFWQVNFEVAPGRWRNAPTESGCYWARLSGFSGSVVEIIANDFQFDANPTIVEVSGSDLGFYANASCGTWSYLGP